MTDLFPHIYPRKGHRRRVLGAELIVDNFAGGGGASMGIEAALGRCVDLAINHDPAAIDMHRRNHPDTEHLDADLFDVDPRQATHGRPVGLAWFSPDCKHFSKALGGAPRSKRVRGLAWVVVRWAAEVRPRVIMLENVEEFAGWGPLRKGQPCKRRKGQTFRQWVGQLERLGYKVEHRELRACDYGAPTIRKRLFVIARRDGKPIVWPQPSHGPATGLKPYRTAAECIDWSIPCPSIFERKRPLAENTLKRIARGIRKFVIEAAKPFIVPVTHQGDSRVHGITEPARTITSAHRGEYALVAPHVVKFRGSSPGSDAGQPLPTITSGAGSKRPAGAAHAMGVVSATLVTTGYGERPGQKPRVPGLDKPLGTIVANGKHALVSAFLAKHFGGNETPGAALADPAPTVTAKDHNALVAASLLKLRGTCRHGQAVDQPMPTVTGGGTHLAEVRAFLIKYYGTAIGQALDEPAHTATVRARLGLVTIHGEDWQIVDIGMRMLQPRELARAQGFPEGYVLTGTKSNQVAKIGNSVCPALARALVAANVPELREQAHRPRSRTEARPQLEAVTA